MPNHIIYQKDSLDTQAPIAGKEVGNFINSQAFSEAPATTGVREGFYKFLWTLNPNKITKSVEQQELSDSKKLMNDYLGVRVPSKGMHSEL